MGWCPIGDRSRIEGRRCLSSPPQSAAIHSPESSGPRCTSVCAMRRATPVIWASDSRALEMYPERPHTLRVLRFLGRFFGFYATKLVRYILSTEEILPIRLKAGRYVQHDYANAFSSS